MSKRPSRAILFIVLLLPMAALAEDVNDESTGEIQFGIEGMTDFPIQAGAGLFMEFSNRVQVSTSVGRMPRIYLDAINDIALSAGWYGEPTAHLISAALDNAFVWRTRVGWRPWKDSHFYWALGWTRASLDGGLGETESITAVTGLPTPSGDETGEGFDISTTVHMLDAEAGWRFPVWKGVSARLALGAAFTVNSDSVVTANWTPRPRGESATNRLESASETYLNDTIETYVHTITATMALGWAF